MEHALNPLRYMNNLIAKAAIITLFLFIQGHLAVAQTDGASGLLKKKAISTLATDRKKTQDNSKQQKEKPVTEEKDVAADSSANPVQVDSIGPDIAEETDTLTVPIESTGFHQSLKTKFIEGNAFFMSLVAMALVLGLSFCIERIIFLSLSEINAKKMMTDIGTMILNGDIEGAKAICRETRGPVASICSQGLERIDSSIEDIERSITSYGTVQAANLENGCSWITLFIAMAPSLGFLGTVIGMVMAFEQIQQAGDISPTIVAAGMKVALITTIFGLIAALILQIFYNFILSKIEHIISQMEESAITLLDIIIKYKLTK